MRRELLTLTLLLLTSAAQAGDVVITANRVEVPAEAVSEDFTVITKEEIKKYGLTSITDVLKYVAGVHISSSGGPGQPTNLFMLGLPGKHVLVMVNGVPLYDPSRIGGEANFEWIDISNIERIEVIKGPQGALYGSDAVAGVINVITKRPKEKEFRVNLEGGKYKSFKERVYGALPLKEGFLSFSFENFKTNGFSATNEKNSRYESDNDGFRYKTGWLSWGYRPDGWLRITGDLKVKGGSVDFDANNPNPQYAVPKAKSTYDNFFTDLKADALISDNFSITATLGHNREEREYSFGSYTGVLRYISLQPVYYFSDNLFITGGVNYRQEKADFSKRVSAHLKSAFAELHGLFYSLSTTVALRRDLHSRFGGKTTYKLSAGYTFKSTGTKVRAQYGTGFKAPSLYQLYGPWVGNDSLKAETSEGWNVGVDQKLPFIKGKLSLTYFKNHVWNLIDWSWTTYKYENTGKALTEGVELKGEVELAGFLTLFGNYTHLRAKEYDPSTGSWEKLARRPEFSYTLGFKSSYGKLSFSAWALHYSDREDSNGKTLGGFTTYNCYASYRLWDNLELYAKGVNLTDKDYELAYGYNTMGRALFVGAIYSFK